VSLALFYLPIADHDRKEYSIEGPLTDDEPTLAAVMRAKATGYDIQCVGDGKPSEEMAAEECRRTYAGYRQVPAGSIVKPNR
jgi:hypothetical protein